MRNGAHHIQATEKLFYNDSLAVLNFPDLLEGQESDKYRILFALRGIDMLLDDFGLAIRDKQDMINQIYASFFKEFGAGPTLQTQLNDKFRTMRQSIFSHMNESEDVNNGIDDGVHVFKIRSRMNGPVIKSMDINLLDGSSKHRLFELLPSYIHMFMNRMFIGKQRVYELTVYHFLERYYSSKIAIENGQTKIKM